MWKVIISASVEDILREYISRYKQYFIDFYADSGVWSEDSMIETYLRSADELYKDIREHIVRREVRKFYHMNLRIQAEKDQLYLFANELSGWNI